MNNISITTDDRDVAATLSLGAMDYKFRNAIRSGAPPEQAFLIASYNTAVTSTSITSLVLSLLNAMRMWFYFRTKI